MPTMQLLMILEILESTIPVQWEDTLASHRQYIRVLEALLAQLVSDTLYIEDRNSVLKNCSWNMRSRRRRLRKTSICDV